MLLDCGDSSDPDDPSGARGALSYAWACSGPNPAGCLSPNGTQLAFRRGAARQSVWLQGGAKGALSYDITCTVSKGDGRSASAAASVQVVAGAVVPTVVVTGVTDAGQWNGGDRVVPSLRFALVARVSSFSPASVNVTWELLSGPDGALLAAPPPSSSAGSSPPSSSPPPAPPPSSALSALSPLVVPYSPLANDPSTSLVLPPGTLQPGAEYLFRLTARDALNPSLAAQAEVRVPVARAPRGTRGRAVGDLLVSPVSGIALTTEFTLRAAEWVQGEDEPLFYQFQVSVDGSGEPPAILSTFKPNATLSGVLLPPGLVETGGALTLQVVVRNAAGVVTAAPATATVTVLAPPQLGTAEAQRALVAAATGRAQQEVSVGQIDSALQIACAHQPHHRLRQHSS